MKCVLINIASPAVRLLLVLIVISTSRGTLYAQDLRVDFSQPGTPVEPGWQAYTGIHENPPSFTPQDFNAFGTVVTVSVAWAGGAADEAAQMVDRGGDGGTDAEALLRDWMGTDTRYAGEPLTLTLRGLPAGTYTWESYHHDTHDQTHAFRATVHDATGTTRHEGMDISSGWSDGITNLAHVSTFATTITSDGSEIRVVFDLEDSDSDVARMFFVLNGFRVIRSAEPLHPSPADGATNVITTTLTWLPPTAFAASHYEVFFGTQADPYANPAFMVQANFFRLPVGLECGTAYSWAVKAYDGTSSYPGPAWHFTTAPEAGPGDLVAGNLVLLNDNAGWCWFQDEKVVYDPVADSIISSTVANYLGYGGESRDGDVDATTYRVRTGRRTRVAMGNHPTRTKGDDHAMGAIWIRPDGRYLHAYSPHNDEARRTYYRITRNPHDGSAWSEESSYDWHRIGNPDGAGTMTYNNLYSMSMEGTGRGRLYNFGRESQRSPNVAYSDDGGQTWCYGGKLSLARTPSGYANGYFTFCGNGKDRIDFIATEHHPRYYNNNVYHGYIQGGTSYNSLGQVVDSNVFDETAPAPEDFTPIFLSSPQDGLNDDAEYHHTWTVDLERDAQGNLCALFTTRYGIALADGQPGDADHRLFYARFDGSEWHASDIARMGGPLHHGEEDYTGLGTIHPNHPGMVVISTPFDPRDERLLPRHEIFKGVSPDQGATWQWMPITWGSTVDNLRPAIPSWDADHTAVIWLRGHYLNQCDYDQSLVGIIETTEERMGLVNYIDAEPANTTLSDGSVFSPGDAWQECASLGNRGTVYIAGDHGTEEAPMLRTSVTGLADGAYDVLAYFWSPPKADWRLTAGFDPTAMLVFRGDSSQQAETKRFEGAVKVLDGPVALYRAYIGRQRVTNGSAIRVYLDDAAGRTAYDGLGVARVLPAQSARIQ